MGHKVVSVEPFYENVIRIHKAAYLAHSYNNIVLIKNAISNKRNEIKLLQKNPTNVGGQSLNSNEAKHFSKDETNKYLVETILFDDIIPYIPRNPYIHYGNRRQTLLKIDIEGHEIFAFENATRLFNELDIKIVFMEWGHFGRREEKEFLDKVLALIQFFFKRNYRPYNDGLLLEIDEWKDWSHDIVWKKD